MSTPADRNANPSASAAVPPTDPATLAPSAGGAMGHPRQPPLTPITGDILEVPGYEIIGELGRGGMGVVYKATNVLMNRPEVLKVVNKALLDGQPGAADRFLREIQSAARLDHENVVKAHSVLRVGELLIFAMEYVEGEDLAKLVHRQGPLPIINACHYISQAAMGLQHAHERGMVHRDIKPHNLILTRRGKRHVVKILDFGLAKAVRGEETVDYLTAAGAMLGTPAFMAPEQATDAANADIRTDIYSLGCTLYHLLTGAPPFGGKTYFAVLKAHESAEAPSLTQLRADVPAELAAAAAKMLAKNPAERYQQPLDVAKALAPIIKSAAPSLKDKPPTHAISPDPAPSAKTAAPLPAWLAPESLTTAIPAHKNTAANQPRRQSDIKTIAPRSSRKAVPTPTMLVKPANPSRWIMLLGGLLGFVFLTAGVGAFVYSRMKKPPGPPATGSGLTSAVYSRPNPTDVESTQAEAPFDAAKAKPLPQASPTPPEPAPGRTPLFSGNPRPPAAESYALPVAPFDAAKAKRFQREWSNKLDKPVDCVVDLGHGVTLKLTLIPPGSFNMGSPENGAVAWDSEKPQHRVALSRPFYLGVTMVTKGQFAAFVNETGYQTDAERARDKATWRNPGHFWPADYAQTDNEPVLEVSWNDADKFCKWLGKKANGKCELPTDAQWEWACRAGTQTAYFFGDNAERVDDYVWHKSESHTHPVGMKKPNPWGLYDMSGNGWQWCQDYYSFYPNKPVINPLNKVGAGRVVRGAAWGCGTEFYRSAFRSSFTPGDYNLGLRVCFPGD